MKWQLSQWTREEQYMCSFKTSTFCNSVGIAPAMCFCELFIFVDVFTGADQTVCFLHYKWVSQKSCNNGVFKNNPKDG